uniref:DUF2345 domain-containing protein n=1 Tax=Iodobacter sp. TaxID=1915058 RepID=UPI0025F87436
ELRQRQAFLHLNAIDGHDPPPQRRTFVHFTPREWLNQGLLSKRHNQEDLKITACKESLHIVAKDEILLTAGGGYIRLKGGNIDIHCPGTVTVKGANHDVSGPAQMNPPLPQFPESICKECLLLALKSASPFVG